MPIAPEMGSDFQTAWDNFANRLKNLEGAIRISASQQGIVVPVSTTPGGGGPTGPPQVPGGPSPGIDPVTGKPLPGTPPIIIQQGVLPVTDLVVTPGAYLGDVYAEVTWQVSELSNAIAFDVEWGTPNPDGTINLVGSYRTSGNSFRLSGLQPNTEYGVQVTASNMLGQSLSTPAGSYYFFLTTTDSSVPPAPSNGPVQVGAGATSVIVSFQPLTAEQAPDVANGNGVYDIQVTNDPTFTNIIREIRSAATVVSFNDIYPSATLPAGIQAVWGPGTNLPFTDLSMLTPGQPFQALVDSEFISFNAPVGNNAVISARNSGTAPLAGGPANHAVGATAVFQTQTVWYARVSAIDASGNQGPWATSSGGVPAGSVTDSMLVGDLNAAHITFGTMRGDRIEANSLMANAIATSTLLATTITLGAGGQFTAGNPPTTGLVVNSQGLTLYSAGVQQVHMDALTGSSTFTGAITGSTITGSTISASNGTSTATLSPSLPYGAGISFQYGSGSISSFSGNSSGLILNVGAKSFYFQDTGSLTATSISLPNTQLDGTNISAASGYGYFGRAVTGQSFSTTSGNLTINTSGYITCSQVTVYGNCYANAFVVSSDEAIKKEIGTPSFSSLEYITTKSKSKTWKYKKDKSEALYIGPMAQNLPVSLQREIKNPDDTATLGADLLSLVGMCWHAIEELNTKVEKMKVST